MRRPPVSPCLKAILAAWLALPAALAAHGGGEERCDGWRPESGWGRRGHYCEARTIDLPDTGALAVDAGRNGGVSVEAGSDGAVRVEARISVWEATEEEARRIATSVTIDAEAGRVEARGPAGDDWSVSYAVWVPRTTDLDLTAHNGGISVAGISGRLRFETTNGGLDLDDLAGDVVGRTSNGGLDIRLTGERWEGAGLDVETSNGGVTLEVPAGYDARLVTGTVNGRFTLDFPVEVSGQLGRELDVTLGDGGSPVKATTTNGSVTIRRP